MVVDLEADTAAMREVASRGFSTATDLADWLVRVLGLPFRQAHHVTGSLVKAAEARGATLAQLTLDEMRAIEPRIHDGVYDVLDVERSVRSRISYGGTAPENVRRAAAAARERFS
jgi:argininosuccinate lyase